MATNHKREQHEQGKGEEDKENYRGRDLTSNKLRKVPACCTEKSQ